MWEEEARVAVRAARAAAEVIAAGISGEFATVMKGAVDPVTDIDEAAEEAIRSVITAHFPHDAMLGEEGGGGDWSRGRVWIFDPLDGTVNFVNRIPHVAVSVALWERGRPAAGVVVDVTRGEEFVAVAGGGARLGSAPIQVSTVDDLQNAVLATGFPYDRHLHARAYLEVMEQVMVRSRGTRRMGSAALDLAWVACGRYDGYWEHGGPLGVQPWDVAAGLLLVTEAGGTLTDNTGAVNRLDAAAFVASNGKIHEDLRLIVDRHMPAHLS